MTGQGSRYWLVAAVIQNNAGFMGGKHPLSRYRNWFNFPRNSINNSFTVVEALWSKKKTKRDKFPGALLGGAGSTKNDFI